MFHSLIIPNYTKKIYTCKMNRLRVVIVRNAAPHDFGGGERFPVFLGQELQKIGHLPVIFSHHTALCDYAKYERLTYHRSWWWSRQNWSGWRVILTPLYVLWQLLLTSYYIIQFHRYKADVVHLQSKDDFIAGSIAGKLIGAHVIWTDHADLKHIWKQLGVWYKNPTGKLVAWAARFADAITLVSQSECRLVSDNLPSTSPIHRKLTVIYNGVNDQKPTHTPIKSRPFTFCIAGRLVVDKGVSEAIAAFKRLHATHHDTRLILIGDGPDRSRFEKQTKGLPVTFRGHQTDPLPEVATADVYLHPTYHEGFSVSLVEASMLQLPIIATDVGGNPEIIHHNKTGLLVPAKDSTALHHAMEQLYSNPRLRAHLATAARRQYLASFVFHTIVETQFIPLYENGL